MQILPKGNYINGSFIKPSSVDGYVDKISPADVSDRVGRFPESLASVDAAVEAAEAAFPGWRDVSIEERIACLRRFQENLDTHRDRLADAITRETGKARWEADREVGLMIAKVDVTLEAGLADIADFGPGGRKGICRYQPMGVVAVLGPFNLPGHLPNGHFVPALVTGCTVVMKPSDHTPATGQIIADLIDRSKFPRGVFNLVQGAGKTIGHALAVHEGAKVVAMTGSTRVGHQLIGDTAGQDKLLALELGGKNSTIVLDDADVDRAAYEICVSGFLTTGQRCTATTRVLAREEIADALTEKIAAITREVKVGYPFDEGVFCGPLVSEAARERFLAAVEQGRKEGAEPVVEGGKLEIDGHEGPYVRPSVHRVKEFKPDSDYQNEEHFGPDIAIVPVSDDEQAIEINATSRYGLALSVFTGDRKRFDVVRNRSKEGIINWNKGTVGASGRLPFGGTGDSGNYRAAGLHAIRYCTYPVASMEEDRSGLEGVAELPGLPLPE